MQRIVNFYEKLPRGPAPEIKPTGILGRYRAKYFEKNPSVARAYLKLEDSRSMHADSAKLSGT